MSADQGLPPAVPPPGDDEAPEPVVLPPWLQGADEPAEPATEVPLPPPPSGLPPPPAPRPSPPSGEDAPTQMMPVPELPPWLQGTGELQQPADAPHAADWVESPAAPPDAADAALTYDEWAAWQKKLAQPHDVEEDLPDLTAEIEESPAAAPGTSALQDAASLPGWFLGLEEISEEELPGWFMETGELGDEPPAAPVPEPAEWADSPFAAGALPADMGDELPDLTDWAGDGEGGEASTQPVVSDDFPFDMEAAPEPAETVESPALDAATEALMAAAAAGTGDFDEPVFEWVSTAGEEAVPPDDDIDEPELDEFLAPPPEASSAPLMDNQTTQDWLTELEGMVADVGAPDSGAATLDPSLEAAAGESEEDWQAAFGFDRPAPPEPVDEPDLYEFLNDAPAEVAETPAAPAAPEPEAPAATDFDELLGPALMAGGAAGFVTSQPQAETVAEPADELTADVLFSDLAEAQAATAPEAEPEAEPAADLSFDVLFGDLLEDDSAAEPDAAPEAAVAADDLTSEAMDIASTPEGEPVLEPADKLALAAMFASSIPDPEAEAPPADNQTVEAMAAVSAPEIEPEPELADSVALAAMFGSGTPEQEIEAPAADDLTIEAMTAVPAPEIEPEPELADSLALAALFADSASGPEGETESEVEPTDDLAFETLFGAEAASEFAASSPEADAESADEPDFETLFGAEAASEFVASTPEPEDESEAELADDLTFEALVGGTGVAAGIAASAPDDEAESADEPDFETLFGAETASEVAASMPDDEAESADEPDFETRFGAEAEAEAEQTDDLTFEALLGGAVVAAGIAASTPDDGAESADEPDFETLFAAETASEFVASTPEAEAEAESADGPGFEILFAAESASEFAASSPDDEAESADEPDFETLFGAEAASEFAASTPEAEEENEQTDEPDFETLFGAEAEAEAEQTDDLAFEELVGGAVVAAGIAASAPDDEAELADEPDFETLFGAEAASEFAASTPEPEAESESAGEPDFETLFAAEAASESAASTPDDEAVSADEPDFETLFAAETASEFAASSPEAEDDSEAEPADDLAFEALVGGAVVAAGIAASMPEPEAESESADEPDFETLFGAEAASEFAASTPEPEAEAEQTDDLAFEELVGGAVVAAGIAASAPDDEAELADEPDFETLFGAEAASEFAASTPEAEDDSEAEPADDLAFEALVGGAVVAAGIAASAPEAEGESEAVPTDDLTFEALVGGAVVAAGIAASSLDPETGQADDGEQPALADLGWLMDMQGSGDLTVVEPESAPEQSPGDLAAFAAMFGGADLTQAELPPDEFSLESQDAPGSGELIAATASENAGFDTGWLRDDIFGEPEADEIAPTGPAGEAGILSLFDDEIVTPAALPDDYPGWVVDDTEADASQMAAGALPDADNWLLGLGLAAGVTAASGRENDVSADSALAAAFLAPAEDEWLQKLQTGKLGEDEEPVDDPAITRTGLTADLVSQVGDVDEYLAMLSAPGVEPERAMVAVPDDDDLGAMLNQDLLDTSGASDDFDWFGAPKTSPDIPEEAAEYDPYRGTQPFYGDELTALSAAPESPDWLSDVTVTAVSAVAISRQQQDRPESELDERLRKLRRRGPTDPADGQADLTAVTPVIGGAVRPEPGMLALTPDQERHSALLASLVGATAGAAGAGAVFSGDRVSSSKPASESRKRDWLKWSAHAERWVIFAVLAVAVLLPFLFPALRIGQPPPAAFEPGSAAAAAADIVDSLPPGALVLVGMDYGPGASPELDPLADALLRHLLLRNAYPVVVSSNPATLARAQVLFDAIATDADFVSRLDRAEPLAGGRDYAIANFLPGGALGLRAFSEDTANLLVPALKAAMPAAFITGLDDFRLIAVLADRTEDVRAWAEQVAPLADAPVIAGVTYSAAPLAEPYVAAGLLDGLWAGYRDGVTYGLMTGGMLTGAPGQTSAPPLIKAAPQDGALIAPLTNLTATFTPTPTHTPSPTASPTRTPTTTPTPVPQRALVAGGQGVNLRGLPATDAPILRVVQPGTEVTVMGYNEDRSWAEVQLDDGSLGWIAINLLIIPNQGAFAPDHAAFGKRQVAVMQQLETDTPEPEATASPSRTARATQEAEASPTPTASRTARPTRTPAPTDTPSPTRTPSRTPTRTPTATRTPTMTFTPSATYTPSMTPTPTPFMVTGSGAIGLPPHTPGYRDERWYAMTMGILVSAGLIMAGAVVNVLRALRRRR